MALLLCQTKWKYSKVVPQGLCSPYLVSRERLHSQEAVSDVDQGKNSLAFFFFLQSFKRVRFLTSLGCVQGLRWSSLLVLMRLFLVVKNPPASAGDIRYVGSLPGLGRSPGEGEGNPLQCSCLKSPRDRGAWAATVHGVSELDTTEVT